jgi:hypothetical protein
MVTNLDIKPTLLSISSMLITRVVLILGGLLWGSWYFGMNLIGWGEPGSDRYELYELYNRIAPAVLMLLVIGIHGAHRILRKHYNRLGKIGIYIISLGLTIMIIGSALEFWIFTESSYDSNSLRHWGWGTYCIGLLFFYIGTAIFGAVLTKLKGLQIAGFLFLGWLPIGALSVGLGTLFGISLPAFSIAVALCGVGYILLGFNAKQF